MPTFARLSIVFALVLGCTGEKPPGEDDTASDAPVDADGDGSPADIDCDDADATRFPGADELCNELDDDCDGSTDEDATDRATVYADADGDGAGDPDRSLETCTVPEGYVATADDCDDADPAIGPTASEVCDDRDVDENCNGSADDADATVDLTTGSTFYADTDADGYGDATTEVVACDLPAGDVTVADDCDDLRADIHPGAIEICDATDTDEDCSGAADDADAGLDARTTFAWYEDLDGDGYGDASTAISTCDVPAGYVSDATDCDPTRADVNPGGTEVCDDADSDEDCDGGADNADPGAFGESTWYADTDGDGHGDPAATLAACDQPAAYVAEATDCDDAASAVYPGAPEQCDGIANDCDTSGAWTSDAELGVASWIDAAGGWSAVTDTLAAGTVDAPVAWTASSDGELRLCTGTWYAQVDGTGVDLVVSGSAGSADTVLDGGATGTVLSSSSGSLAVSGVTLQNGAAANGGGLYCLATDLTMDDVVVEANAATSAGGGVYLHSCTDASLVDVWIDGNAAASGGGLYATTSDGLVLDGLVVEGNAASVVGGGLSLSDSDFTLVDSTVQDNSAGASYPAGGMSISGSTGTVEGVTLAGNTARSGAGAQLSASTVDIVDSVISGNVATSYGAALHVYYTSTVAVSGTTFTANLSGSDAPLYLDTNATGTFDTCTFSANEGESSGVFGFASTASASVVASDFTDNVPYDAYAADSGYTFGLAASATCDDATGCY
jgi:hypothetical protein